MLLTVFVGRLGSFLLFLSAISNFLAILLAVFSLLLAILEAFRCHRQPSSSAVLEAFRSLWSAVLEGFCCFCQLSWKFFVDCLVSFLLFSSAILEASRCFSLPFLLFCSRPFSCCFSQPFLLFVWVFFSLF